MLTKLYTFSVSFHSAFGVPSTKVRGQMDVHLATPYNQRINHLGVINRVSLTSNVLQADPPAQANLADYSLNLRDLPSLDLPGLELW